MKDNETIIIDMNSLDNSVPNNNILDKNVSFLISKKLTLDEYVQCMNNGNNKFKYTSYYVNGIKVGDEYILYEYVTMDSDDNIHYHNPVQSLPILEAMEKQYINVKLYG